MHCKPNTSEKSQNYLFIIYHNTYVFDYQKIIHFLCLHPNEWNCYRVWYWWLIIIISPHNMSLPEQIQRQRTRNQNNQTSNELVDSTNILYKRDEGSPASGRSL